MKKCLTLCEKTFDQALVMCYNSKKSIIPKCGI